MVLVFFMLYYNRWYFVEKYTPDQETTKDLISNNDNNKLFIR